MRGGLSRRRALLGAAAVLGLAACDSSASSKGSSGAPKPASDPVDEAASGSRSSSSSRPATTSTRPATSTSPPPATPAEIAARATVPVLCWHQLRNWTSVDGAYARNLLICPPARFRAQLDALDHGGWNTISPDRYLDHLSTGAKLPTKPVMLTFDDSQGSQMTEGLPQLLARDMTATFFAMTVVLDNRGWLSRRDLKTLDAKGMTIGAHTWDHHRVDQYVGKDWRAQLEAPRELLEKTIGKPVVHFAYPYGAWNHAALAQVAAAGYRSAYQLADRKPDPTAPLLTLRRDLVNSTWTGPDLIKHLSGVTR